MADIAIPAISLALVLIENFRILHPNRSSEATADVERAKTILRRMQAYLTDCSSKPIGESSEGLQNRAKEIQDGVYDIEDALSMFLVKIPHHSHSNIFSKSAHNVKHVWIPSLKFSHKLKQIEFSHKLEQIEERLFLTNLDLVHSRTSNGGFEEDYNNLAYHQVVEEDEIVGFETAITKLIQQLREEEYISQRPLMISVFGPGGSGKTTLVKNVYERRSVRAAFDCHAFVDVRRSFELQTLLLTMLRTFEAQSMQEPVAEHHHHPEETCLRKKLGQILEKKKYLVVLDDVWSEQDLRRIVNALPKGLSGSKIITTTRYRDIVASWHASSDDYIHDLSIGLSSQEANKLFCKKAFHGSCDNCPKELLDLAQTIISGCGGLPLAISTVGTFLARQQPQTFGKWKKFHDSFGSNLRIVGQAWEPSYRDLPDHLKCCFLYFSVFPEDNSIKRERLIRLWVAEGFVKQGRGTPTMEEVADGYLHQLIGRKLVDVSSREIDGQVRSCHVSNLVRNFIMSKVESFVTVLESNNNRAKSGEKIRRLSAHYVSIKDLLRSAGELNQTRTLLVFGPSQQAQCDEIEKVLKTLKYLRVLDLKGIPLEDFPKSISGLILLKYISMRKTKIKTVPSSINRLAFLETLDLKRTQVTKLPEEIYKLDKMRHLLVSRGSDCDDGPTQGVEISAGNIGALSELQKLSLIKVGNNRTILKALAELIGLRKLGLTDLIVGYGTELCCAIGKMKSLSTLELRSTNEEEYLDLDHRMESPLQSLERLSLKGRLRCLPQWVPMLHSVVKISLKWSKLDADANPLEPLQALPNMMELHLVCYYTGQVLEFKAKTFMKLKILSIKQFDQLHTLKVESGAMPNLEKLTLSNCKSLNLPPLGMEGLRKLEELFLHDMPTELIAKLQRDGEDRQADEHIIPVIHSYNPKTGFQNLSEVIAIGRG